MCTSTFTALSGVRVWHASAPLEGAKLRGDQQECSQLHFISSSLITPAPHHRAAFLRTQFQQQKLSDCLSFLPGTLCGVCPRLPLLLCLGPCRLCSSTSCREIPECVCISFPYPSSWALCVELLNSVCLCFCPFLLVSALSSPVVPNKPLFDYCRGLRLGPQNINNWSLQLDYSTQLSIQFIQGPSHNTFELAILSRFQYVMAKVILFI